MNQKDYRRFYRIIRASNMSKYRKTGCDMGWYGHFIGPVPTPRINKVVKRIMSNIDRIR